MTSHWRNWLVTVAGIVVAAGPAIWADPALKSLVLNHPFLAAYVPVFAGVVTALYRAWSMTGSKKPGA